MPPAPEPTPAAPPAPERPSNAAFRTFTRRDALTNASWAAGGAFFRNLLSGLFTFILTRLLTPDNYGLVALTAAAQALVGRLLLTGIHDALIQRNELSPRFLNTAITSTLITATAAALPVAILAPLAGQWFGEPALPTLWVAAIFAAYISALSTVPRALLSRHLNYRGLMLAQIGAILCGGLVAVCAAALGAGPWSLLLQTGTINLGLALITGYLAWRWHVPTWRFRWQIDSFSLRALGRFAPSVSGFAIIAYIVQNADDQIVGLRLGATPLGYYVMAYLIMSWVTADVLGGVGSVLFPILARLQTDPQRLQAAYLEGLQITCTIAFPLLALIIIGAPLLIPWLLSDQWQPAVLATQVLCFAGLREAMTILNGYVYRVLGVPERQMILAAAGMGIYLVAYWVGADQGIDGVAFFFALASWVYLPAALWMLFTTANISPRQWLNALFPPALAAVALSITAAGTLHLARAGWEWPIFPALALTGTAAAASYALLLLLVPAPAVTQLTQQIIQIGRDLWSARHSGRSVVDR